MRKTRADSTLGSLPQERQAAIADYAFAHSLAETVEWLRQDGIRTSSAALSVWLSSYRLAQQLRANESTVEKLLEEFKRAKPDATPEEIRAAGQSFFSALALQQQDPKIWAMTQSLALKREELEFDREKFKAAIKSKLEAGLDELAAAFRANPEAMDLYNQARALVTRTMQ